MRLFLTILLAGIVSIALGAGAIAAIATFLPSYDDAAGRGLGQAFMLLFVGVYAATGMLALGLAARRGEGRLTVVALVLAGLPAAIVLFAALQALSVRADFYELKKQFFSVVTVLLPLEALVFAQWLILRSYLRKRAGIPIFASGSA